MKNCPEVLSEKVLSELIAKIDLGEEAGEVSIHACAEFL
jgi:hypothetical protein